MKRLHELLDKRRQKIALKEMHKMVLDDAKSLHINAADKHLFEKFRHDPFMGFTIRLYPIALNKNVQATPYIKLVVDSEAKITVPLSWKTIAFVKESLAVDFEKIHRVAFDLFNNGTSTQPFERCYSTASMSWKD